MCVLLLLWSSSFWFPCVGEKSEKAAVVRFEELKRRIVNEILFFFYLAMLVVALIFGATLMRVCFAYIAVRLNCAPMCCSGKMGIVRTVALCRAYFVARGCTCELIVCLYSCSPSQRMILIRSPVSLLPTNRHVW